MAEDSATQRAVCVNVLRDAGLEVHEALDGRYALDIWRIIRPDGVVLDLRLPRRNGIDVLRKLRSDRKIGKTPVIVVTADERESWPRRPTTRAQPTWFTSRSPPAT